jgi:hypothetical protein
MDATKSGLHTGDLARRITHRRQELGMSIAELAERTDMATGYVTYLERSPNAALSVEALLRLAVALDTSSSALAGGLVDRPPGYERAGIDPALEVLSREQCEAHLAPGGVGRVIISAQRGPVALPVNFAFTEGNIVFRTSESTATAITAEELVGFEVDQIDGTMSEGWSVLITGQAFCVEEPEDLRRIASLDIEAWAGGIRDRFFRILPDEISGRTIIQRQPSLVGETPQK